MNKERKRRQKRKERDLRWIAMGATPVVEGSHRYKKVYGAHKKDNGGRPAFWCNETDNKPLFARLYLEAEKSWDQPDLVEF